MIQFQISTDPDQKFATVINNRRVTFRLRYNTTTERWSFDLSMDDLPVLYGRRIVTGVDLLAAFDFDIGIIFAWPITPDGVADRQGLPAGDVRIFQTTEAEVETIVA